MHKASGENLVKLPADPAPLELLEQAKALQETLVTHRRYLHQHAEVGFDLPKTRSYVEDRLREMGLNPVPCGRSGVVAKVEGGRPGKVFLLRADMDALPIWEESGETFACREGTMHACGHDLHTAMLLGAAQLLVNRKKDWQGCVKLMFQPAEELLAGAEDMVAAGVLEQPSVDAAMMIHVMAGLPLPTGTAVVSSGGVSAPGADYFTVRIKGKGCHGAMPNTGIDPLIPSSHLLLGLQTLLARESAMHDRAALTVGSFHAGQAANVIPDEVELKGTLRAFEQEHRQFLKDRLESMATSIANAFRASAEVAFDSGCPPLKNDGDLSRKALLYATELLGESGALNSAKLAGQWQGESKVSGSEDFAVVSQKVPSIMVALAAGNSQEGYSYPQHHPMVRYDESVLSTGSALMAYTALRWLEETH